MGTKARVLAMSAASGKVGHVLVLNDRVVDLGMSAKASKGPTEARTYAMQRIELLRPDVVVTELLMRTTKKGDKTRSIIEALTSVANVANVSSMEVARGRSQANRFEEATDLAQMFPAMRRYLPKVRKPWESEPKTLIYFEALSLYVAAFGQASQAPAKPA